MNVRVFILLKRSASTNKLYISSVELISLKKFHFIKVIVFSLRGHVSRFNTFIYFSFLLLKGTESFIFFVIENFIISRSAFLKWFV